MTKCKHTVYVDIFALYIFSPYSRFSNIREDIYNLEITCIMPHRVYNFKNANVSPREIPNFRKFAKICTRENIYVHSIYNIGSKRVLKIMYTSLYMYNIKNR